MRHVKSALIVLGALTLLLLAGNTVAYAATGKSLLLGKTNYAGKQTGVTRTTSGPVLNLTARSSANPPLSTNARGKVANLNADRLDGLDSASLRTRSRVYTSSFESAGQALVHLPMSPGNYLVSYSVYVEAETDAPISVSCHVLVDRPGGAADVRVASDATDLNSTHIEHAMSGSGLVSATADADVKLKCDAVDGAFSTAQVPVQIVVTPTTRLSTQHLVASVAAPTPS